MEIRNKIFGIGLGRTASRSVTGALQILGYKIKHGAVDMTQYLLFLFHMSPKQKN